MNITMTNKIRGYYELQILDKNGDLTKKIGSDNLVLDTLINKLNSGAYMSGGSGPEHEMMYHIALGTGTAEPTVTDTALANELKRETFYWETMTYIFDETVPKEKLTETIKKTKSFGLGAVVGNITEVGIIDSDGDFITRSLIKDAAGNPTAITVTSEEQLYITYYIELAEIPLKMTGSFDVVDKLGSVVDTISYEGRCSGKKFTQNTDTRGGALSRGVNSKEGWLGGSSNTKTYLSSLPKPSDGDWGYGTDVISVKSGVEARASTISALSSGIGYHRRYRWSVGQGNLSGGITRICTYYYQPTYPGIWVIHFDKPLMKTNSDILEIETSVIWERI